MNDSESEVRNELIYQLKNGHQLLLNQMHKIIQLVRDIKKSSDECENEWDEKWYRLYHQVVSFLPQFKVHIYKEEHFLYPLLASHFDRETNLLMVADYEHKTIEQRMNQFIDTFEKRRIPFKAIEALSLLSCLEFAHTALLDHIHKEEKLLLPLVERHIQNPEKEKLAFLWNSMA